MIDVPGNYPEAKYFLKFLLLLLLYLFPGVVRSEDNFETWLGHTSDWAIFYIDEKDHEGRCVGKRISGEFQYQLSISGSLGVWNLLIDNSAGIDSLPTKYSLVTLDFDNGEKYSLGASDAGKANLITLNLPAGVIDSLRDANWLSVKVDNISIDDLSLRRGSELISALVACHQDRGQSDEEPISAKTAEVENIARLNWQINELRGRG
ncbi:hypothetical protein U5801_18950, partial [Lamprobacter modestohalophilus]|uniref:hypothetical protein n=1 Tax=Lamprobacter modestohalophilus TaxID=1064514 RepID=UPI002ADEAF7F